MLMFPGDARETVSSSRHQRSMTSWKLGDVSGRRTGGLRTSRTLSVKEISEAPVESLWGIYEL